VGTHLPAVAGICLVHCALNTRPDSAREASFSLSPLGEGWGEGLYWWMRNSRGLYLVHCAEITRPLRGETSPLAPSRADKSRFFVRGASRSREMSLKSPFYKGGFREILSKMRTIPPPFTKGGNKKPALVRPSGRGIG
jgi:hypothetical protein